MRFRMALFALLLAGLSGCGLFRPPEPEPVEVVVAKIPEGGALEISWSDGTRSTLAYDPLGPTTLVAPSQVDPPAATPPPDSAPSTTKRPAVITPPTAEWPPVTHEPAPIRLRKQPARVVRPARAVTAIQKAPCYQRACPAHREVHDLVDRLEDERERLHASVEDAQEALGRAERRWRWPRWLNAKLGLVVFCALTALLLLAALIRWGLLPRPWIRLARVEEAN